MADEKLPPDPLDSTATPEPKAEPRPVSDPFLDAQLRAVGSGPTKTTEFSGSAPAFPTSTTDSASVKRGGVGLVTVLIFSTAAACGGAVLALAALSQPALMKQVGLGQLVAQGQADPGQAGAQMAAVAARLAALEGRVSRLEGPKPAAKAAPSGLVDPAAPAAAPPAPIVDTATLDGELKGVSGRVTAIETRLAALDPTGAGGAIIASLQAEIAGLKIMVQTLQSQAAQAPSPGVTFAVINLVEAASRPGPFWPEFETVRAALPGVAEVTALEDFARKGVPTRTLLQERFSALEPAIVASDRAAQKESGFWGWIKGFFADLVRVEKVADVNGTSAQSSLLRAKVKLDQGDLAAAVEEVKAISPAPTVVAEWIEGAQNRLTLESRLAAVRGAVERGTRTPPPQMPTLAPSAVVTAPVGIIPAAPGPVGAPMAPAAPQKQGNLP
ncbi:MAG: hypothetical protein O9270_18845 [Aquidulcibacter sp.]|jgi:hypothetical protein|uniref:COG4223 family protein n=1 Tax=Aquidulcibacter sp. TaxID=2052990 RepID=UPI0022C5B6DC|nr:hypothetical protein [Aquidulcibacter sp.]MCZ8210240.1 hypothetical protein [Aquidulcibacter sp.]